MAKAKADASKPVQVEVHTTKKVTPAELSKLDKNKIGKSTAMAPQLDDVEGQSGNYSYHLVKCCWCGGFSYIWDNLYSVDAYNCCHCGYTFWK